MDEVKFFAQQQSLDYLAGLFHRKRLNLNPVFQRQSVWRDRQREKLVESVFRGYPIPAIFLYKHDDRRGDTVYEVVDGKQRLETLFRFTGTMHGGFAVRLETTTGEESESLTWRALRKRKLQARIEEYRLNVIEIEADLSDIIELFVRLNSTGNALTGQEIRNAKFYQSAFLKAAKALGGRWERFLRKTGTITPQQARRMKHVELMAELIYSADTAGVANKKRVLDKAMQQKGLTGRALRSAKKQTAAALNRLRRMFPSLDKSVRFHKLTDFYSLAVAIQELDRNGCILTDRRRNADAWKILVALSAGVDELSVKNKGLQPLGPQSPREQLFREYLMSVREGVDAAANRKTRHRILLSLLEPIFQRKDSKRLFSQEQRRILWNRTEEPRCQHPGCRKPLTWSDFHADHVQPFAKGGKAVLENGALLCPEHNRKKGAKAFSATA